MGGALAAVMAVVVAVALFQEASGDNSFGVVAAGMVLVFGVQLMKIGYDLARGRPRMAVDPDPLDKLWNSETRVYPYLPYSQLEVRGRNSAPQ